jgi:AcrR family transcriptional regulator
MSDNNLNTEQKILEAARAVFIEKGYEGARMQEIADEAGINKALLHYYYRSKDKLFEGVFRDAFFQLVPHIVQLIKSDLPLFEKIENFARQYITVFQENPYIPGFILHELSRNPGRIVTMISDLGIDPNIFIGQVEQEIEKGTIHPVNPYHLIVNMLALCIFPFVAAPIINNIIFNKKPDYFDQFIEERKNEVPLFIINAIKKNE